MEQKPLATEIINDMQERLINVVCEIDSLDIDCEHALFVLAEILEEDACDMLDKMDRIDSLCGIAYDYVSKIQSCISDIVIRERNSKHDKGED